MNFWNLVYRAAEYGIILPGIFLCIIPVADWLIIPRESSIRCCCHAWLQSVLC